MCIKFTGVPLNWPIPIKFWVTGTISAKVALPVLSWVLNNDTKYKTAGKCKCERVNK